MTHPFTFKKKMAYSFSRSADVYDSKATLQKEVASKLRKKIEMRFKSDDRILDVGCGTGFLSLPLLETGARIHAIDMAAGMISLIQRKTPQRRNIFLAIADGEYLPYMGQAFDMIISSLTYHWIFNLEEAFHEAFRVLKEGGGFHFALPGRESLLELRIAYSEVLNGNTAPLPPLVNFPSKEQVEDAMRQSGFRSFEITRHTITRIYPDFINFLRSMKMIGAGNPFQPQSGTLKSRTALRAIGKIYHERHSEKNGVRASYEILFCSARKPHPVRTGIDKTPFRT